MIDLSRQTILYVRLLLRNRCNMYVVHRTFVVDRNGTMEQLGGIFKIGGWA